VIIENNYKIVVEGVFVGSLILNTTVVYFK